MKKTLIALVCTFALSPAAASAVEGILLSTAATSTSAAPSERAGCASKAEMRRVRNGQTIRKVRSIFGAGRGRVDYNDGLYKTLEFKPCDGRFRAAYVEFTKRGSWRVDNQRGFRY